MQRKTTASAKKPGRYCKEAGQPYSFEDTKKNVNHKCREMLYVIHDTFEGFSLCLF